MTMDWEKQREADEEARFGLIVASFMKKWRPTDPYEAHDFEIGIFEVIAACYKRASAPFAYEISIHRNSLRFQDLIATTPIKKEGKLK